MVDDFISLQKMQVVSWVYLILLSAGSWIFVSWSFAWAVFAGGLISISSFVVSHRDVVVFFDSIASPQAVVDNKKVAKKSKFGLLIKFWFRFGLIGIVLLLLLKFGKANVFGLILGLSTIVFSVTFSALNVARRYFFSRR